VPDGENAGVDIYVPNDVVFKKGERKFVGMGVRAVVYCNNEPVHYWMPARSSISKTGLMLMNSIGVIDKSYRGELIAAFWNTTDNDITIKKGQRLVQIVGPTMQSFHEIKIVELLDTTERGEGGYGYTG